MSDPKITALHKLYCELTGFDLRLTMDRERVWFDFINAGFGQDDLRLVVRHLRRGITNKERNAGALRFSNLVGQLDYFEEDLAAAKKAAGLRPKPPATKLIEQKIGDVSRTVEVPNQAEPRPARGLVAETLRTIADNLSQKEQPKPNDTKHE